MAHLNKCHELVEMVCPSLVSIADRTYLKEAMNEEGDEDEDEVTEADEDDADAK